MKFKALLLALSLSSAFSFAQDKVKYSKEDIKKMETYLFNEGFNIPSPKKISTIIMKDGTINKGYCSKVDSKRGQIYEIAIKDSATKKQMTFNAENVSEMYIYPSNAEKNCKSWKIFWKHQKFWN